MKGKDKSLLFSAVLKDSFRDPVEYFTGEGVFVGRGAELARLKSIITNRNSATVLLSGTRGSGKTSLVRKAVSSASSSISSPVLVTDVPVIPRYSSIDDDSKVTSAQLRKERRSVLLSLVSSLYFSVQDNEKIKLESIELLETLYDRTFYSEEKQSNAAATSSSRSTETGNSYLREVNTTYDFSPASLITATNVIFGVSIIPLASALDGVKDLWLRIVLVTLYAILWFISFKKVSVKTKKSSTDKQGTVLSERLSDINNVIIDLSDNYFETYLKRFLRNNSKTKFVFVFDELDKDLGVPAETIIKYLKNLFTLSNGIYIFITAEDQYYKLSEPNSKIERGPDYTTFTDRIFLNQLTQQQIGEIIDEIIVEKECAADDLILEKIKHYLGWASKNIAFDLYRKLDELIDYNGSKIRLKVYDVDKLNLDKQLNIDRDWELCATYQAYVDTVFEGHRHPWNNLYNTVLLDALHGIADVLKETGDIEIVSDDYWSAAKATLTSERQSKNVELINHVQMENISNAVQDLLVGMEAANFTLPPYIIPEKSIKYSTTNDGSFPSKEELISLSKTQLPYEADFIKAYQELDLLVNRLQSAGLAIDDASMLLLKKAESIDLKLSQIRRNREKSSVVRDITDQTQKTIDTIGSIYSAKLLSSLVEASPGVSNVPMTGLLPTGHYLWQHDPIMADLYRTILVGVENYLILFKAVLPEKIVVVTLNFPADKKEELFKILRSRPDGLSTLVINIIYDDNMGRLPYSPPGLNQVRLKQNFSNVLVVKNKILGLVKNKLAL